MFFAETLRNGKQHEKTQLSTLEFLKYKKKSLFLLYRPNIFFKIFVIEASTDVCFPNLYHFPKFQQKIFIIVDKNPEMISNEVSHVV